MNLCLTTLTLGRPAQAFIEPDLKTAHLKIYNTFNPFSGFMNATYILKSAKRVTKQQIKAVLQVCDIMLCGDLTLSSRAAQLAVRSLACVLHLPVLEERQSLSTRLRCERAKLCKALSDQEYSPDVVCALGCLSHARCEVVGAVTIQSLWSLPSNRART